MKAHVTMATYSINSVVRGHPIYKEVRTLFLGEVLQCGRAGDIHDLHVGATNKPGNGIVGHVKMEFSAPL